MRRTFLSILGGAVALGLLTVNAVAFPAAGSLKNTAGADSGAVSQVHWRWHHRHHSYYSYGYYPQVYGYYYSPNSYYGYRCHHRWY